VVCCCGFSPDGFERFSQVRGLVQALLPEHLHRRSDRATADFRVEPHVEQHVAVRLDVALENG
jgi:hypothetical protein